jgi:uncharacterized protein (DUF1501 family)
MGQTAAPTQRCLACDELELARVSDARPVQTLPVPAAALAGFPEGREPGALTRRRLLQWGLAGFASVYAPRALGFQSVWEAAAAEAAAAPANQRCVVLLYIAGGNDGLNCLVPTDSNEYAAYTAKRPVLHRGLGPTASGTVGSFTVPGTGGQLAFAAPLVSAAAGGDNGKQVGLDTLYGSTGTGSAADAQLALMPAVDYTPPSLSHFDSSDYWFAGALQKLTTGWLGRWLDLHGSLNNPLQAISIDSAISKSIRTTAAPICAIPSLSGLGFTMRTAGSVGSPGVGFADVPPGTAAVNGAIGQISGNSAGNPTLQRSRDSYAQTITVAQQVSGAPPASVSAQYPANSQLAKKLQLATTLLKAPLGTRVITIHWGALDTHGNQLATQDPQLVQLSACLGAFQADLAANGLADRVCTLVFSEFGRRVAENASGGTDHGAGGLMMLQGQNVRGGWAAPFPGVKSAELDQLGDLKVPTDFRTVYASVINEWLGTDPTEVIAGLSGLPGPQRYDGTSSNLFDTSK